MTAGDQYRVRAANLEAQAITMTNPATREGLLSLARSYVLLAEMVDRNSAIDIVHKVAASGRR